MHFVNGLFSGFGIYLKEKGLLQEAQTYYRPTII